MGLRAYRATWLPSYAATCRGKQRGTRNGTPRYICSLLLFSSEESLKAGSTAYGHDIGELVIVGCRAARPSCCWTTGLLGYRATLLPSYLAIGSQHSPAGRWLLIDILAAPNRARTIHRVIDSVAGLLTNLVERFLVGVFRCSFLIPGVGDDLTDGLDTAD